MHTWIFIMVIFSGSQSAISKIDALSTYPSSKACLEAMNRATAIQMPMEREFRCIKIRHQAPKGSVCNITSNFKGENCAPSKSL